jgi:flagellar biosynthetic protein FliR
MQPAEAAVSLIDAVRPGPTGALVLARLASFVFAASLVPAGRAPRSLRAGIAAALGTAALLSPPLRLSLFTAAGETGPLAAAGALDPADLACEIAIGAVLGWLLIAAFAAVRGACWLAAREIGLTPAQALDPCGDREGRAFACTGSLLALAISFGLGLHLDAVRLIIGSFDALPPRSARLEAIPDVCGRLVMGAGPAIIGAAVSLALPLLAVAGLVTLVQGLLGRMLPQSELVISGVPLRIVLCLLALGVFLPQAVEVLHGHVQDALDEAVDLLRWLNA